MNANELLEYLLETKNPPEPLDEAAAYEASSLVSGSFVYNLHRALWLEGLTMQTVTNRLEEGSEVHGVTASGIGGIRNPGRERPCDRAL